MVLNPIFFVLRGSTVVSIPACHAGNPGSIPGLGVFDIFYFFWLCPRIAQLVERETVAALQEKSLGRWFDSGCADSFFLPNSLIFP